MIKVDLKMFKKEERKAGPEIKWNRKKARKEKT